jgi:hypothetical protein
MFRVFFINVEISTNLLTSTFRKIGTQPLIIGDKNKKLMTIYYERHYWFIESAHHSP